MPAPKAGLGQAGGIRVVFEDDARNVQMLAEPGTREGNHPNPSTW